MHWLVEIFIKVGLSKLFEFLSTENDKRKAATTNQELGAQRAESHGAMVIEEIGNDQSNRASQHSTDDYVDQRLRDHKG